MQLALRLEASAGDAGARPHIDHRRQRPAGRGVLGLMPGALSGSSAFSSLSVVGRCRE
jgi:hypothetical protein